MKRNLQIRIDRAWIIVAWFVFAGLIWVPVVHGVDSSEDATRLSYGFAGYYSVTTTSDGNTTNQFDRSQQFPGCWNSRENERF